MNKYILKHIQEASETGYKPKLFDTKEIVCFVLFLLIVTEIFILYLIFSKWGYRLMVRYQVPTLKMWVRFLLPLPTDSQHGGYNESYTINQ